LLKKHWGRAKKDTSRVENGVQSPERTHKEL
jgi:hypothetical protein